MRRKRKLLLRDSCGHAQSLADFLLSFSFFRLAYTNGILRTFDDPAPAAEATIVFIPLMV
jgi:hypothetical protein